MIDFLVSWGSAVWRMLHEGAFLFLVGLTLAGLLSLILNAGTMARLVRGGRGRTVLRAALLGVPLPLCSCSVLPVASELRKAGMGKGGVTAFLIATPESGVDSILLTYSLTDPLLTVARPITAFLTAFAAGMIQTESNSEGSGSREAPSCTDDSCACRCQEQNRVAGPVSIATRVGTGIRYAYTELIHDLAPYLLVGFLLAGLFEALFGSYLTGLPVHWKTGWVGYAGAIVVGLPLYVCATSSTPLAATLLTFGFSPGAVLVFLLVGPATNIASLAVVKQILGIGATVRYLAAIIVVAVLCGIAADWLYRVLDMAAIYRAAEIERHTSAVYSVSALALAFLIVYHSGRKYLRRLT